MIKQILHLFGAFWDIFQWVFYLTIPFVICFTISFLYYFLIKKYRFKKGEHKALKKRNMLVRLFYDFPKQFWLDRFSAHPDTFNKFGVHIFCGEQGSGKTVALTKFLLDNQKEYPLLKVATNYGYKYEDFQINHWKDIVFNNNGIYGQIMCIDEIQNWFNSLQSKDFPPEMMTEITQQRKQRKIIVGTAQVFSRIAKPIREQISFVYKPLTIFGCLTIVRKYKPKVSSNDGQLDELKLRSIYFFVHNKELRNAFDTYHKISKMSEQGFKPTEEQLHNVDNTFICVNNDD